MLFVLLLVPTEVAAVGASANGAEVTRREECNEYGTCVETRVVFHHVETPSGIERFTTNGSFSYEVVSPAGVAAVSTQYHQQEMIRDGAVHELRDRQRMEQTVGGQTCELRVARHQANGSTQYDTVTECIPS
jgi:hypothetical protein